MIQIQSAQYNDSTQFQDLIKFQALRYTLAGSADYTNAAFLATAWRYHLVVSASASALGAGISAGGLDSLRTSFAITAVSANMLTFVSDEAVTASAYLTEMKISRRLNPTMYEVDVKLARAK